MTEPCTKWVKRVFEPARIPELINKAFQLSMSGKPGPVYLDFPGYVLYRDVEKESIACPAPWTPKRRAKSQANGQDVAAIMALLEKAERPRLSYKFGELIFVKPTWINFDIGNCF